LWSLCKRQYECRYFTKYKAGQAYLINHQDNIGADLKTGSMIDVFVLPILGGFGHFINKNTR
jgi:hypothetical protein